MQIISKNYPEKLKIVLSILLITVFNYIQSQTTTLTYATPGSTVWTVPVCVASVTVEVWGGGGGGGGAWSKNAQTVDVFGSNNEACAGAGGGGGGGYTKQVFTVAPGQTYNITVGAGGAGGTSVTTPLNNTAVQNGSNGGNSSFVGGSINLIANGGSGGAKAFSYNPDYTAAHFRNNGAGGAGGSGNGTIVYAGGTGRIGTTGGSFDMSGSGGGGAGSGGAGSNGNASVSNNPMVGGAGGAIDGGKGGDGKKTASNSANSGNNGVLIGGGGSGGLTHQTGFVGTARVGAGGAGANGQARITYVAATPPIVSISVPICNTNSTTVNLFSTASSTVSPTYVWSNTGGNINNGGATLNPNVNSPGSYTLVAYNGAITCSASANVVLTNITCNLLAIELASITAKRIDDIVNVSWETYSEINNAQFEVHRSIDGINFETIKKIKGSGNSFQKISYTIIDENPSKGVNYYRLKNIDKNGQSTFSKIVSVDAIISGNNLNALYPNPAHSELTFEFYSLTNDKMEIEIIDYLGRIILQEEKKIEEGASNHKINVSELENGIYSIKIKFSQSNYLTNKKIIKN